MDKIWWTERGRISNKARNILLQTRTVKYKCAVCGWTKDLTADHKVRLADGGETCISNLQWLCVKCHTLKTKKENGQ